MVCELLHVSAASPSRKSYSRVARMGRSLCYDVARPSPDRNLHPPPRTPIKTLPRGGPPIEGRDFQRQYVQKSARCQRITSAACNGTDPPPLKWSDLRYVFDSNYRQKFLNRSGASSV